MSARANRCIAVVAFVCFAAAILLSRQVEPGLHVEAVTLAGSTPALQFLPASPGPHPVALLVHGAIASKETLFRFGEALAAAGFVCFAVDSPGHGASTRSVSVQETVHTLEELARTLGSVDVFVGHSMGSGAGAMAVRAGGLRPRLFVALGSNPDLGENGPPLLLLAGRFEEFVSPDRLRARTDARLVLSPWSDHVLEPYDPCLVNAAVEAACAAVGKTPPAAPTAWRWRFAGVVLGMLGALGLIGWGPELWPRLAQVRGLLVPGIFIVAVILTTGSWVGSNPQLRRLPLQLTVMVATWLALVGVGKRGIARWSLPAMGALLTIGCVIGFALTTANSQPGETIFFSWLLSMIAAVTTLFLLAGTVFGRIAAYRGSRRDGDIAMAIFVGYAIGQWMPKLF